MNATKNVPADTENFICQNCGGVMKFDIGSQKFACSSCKAEYDLDAISSVVKEYDFSTYAEREKASVPFDGAGVVSCKNCGLEITLDEKQISGSCPMCGSTQLAACKQRSGIPPEAVVPFRIDRFDAQNRFRAWVKSRRFAPGDFKKKYGEGVLCGMYLPFWTYDASVFSRYKGEGGKHKTVKGKDGKDRTVTDWFPVSGAVTSLFDDVLVCASEKEKDIQCILPFNTVTNAKPYADGYLSGYYAEIYRIKADKAFESAKDTMEHEMRSMAEAQVLKQFDTTRNMRLDTKYTDVTYKHVLLPIWSSAFGYNGRTYHYLITGETGKVSGERPWSAAKIAAVVLAAVAAVVIAIMLFANDGELLDEFTENDTTGGYEYAMVWTGQGHD